MIKLVGLKTCDTCRKAQKWLENEGIAFTYHDVRSDGLTPKDVALWIKALGPEQLVNRRSTTWRTLNEADKSALTEQNAVNLIVDNPTLMKRPLFIVGETFILGFNKEQMASLQKLTG